jgi:hypothetical protein
MRTTNANFDTYHDVDHKHPLYSVTIHSTGYDVLYDTDDEIVTDALGHPIVFAGETTAKYYSNGAITGDTDSHEQLLIGISGGTQTVTPDKGKASISAVTIKLLDKDDTITAFIAADTESYLHRKKVTIKAGYAGLGYTDFLTVFTGWITGLKVGDDLAHYIITITDPQKWAQKYICRDATGNSPIIYRGNPINILLAILTSTGLGANGDYDWRAEGEGVGIDASYVDITGMETVRDRHFPGDSHYLQIKIEDKVKAKDLIETEILKVLNCYPKIDAQGRYGIVPFKPPITGETVQSFTMDNIVGLPKYDTNLDGLRNEIEFQYDFDPSDGEYDSEVYYAHATSINNRGQGPEQITVKSKGLRTSLTPSSISSRITDIMSRRKTVALARYADPPAKITIKTWFENWLTEAGDIVPITHSLLPDLEAGTRGLTATRMEVLTRSVDWQKGQVTINLLNTGFAKGPYCVIGQAGATIGSLATWQGDVATWQGETIGTIYKIAP